MSFSRRALLVSSLVLMVAGCATQPRLIAADQSWPELEAIGVSAGRHGLTVRLASTGCTVKADIVFRLDRADGRAVIAFARRRLETCRLGEARLVDLVFSYEELGIRHGERIIIANPIKPSA